MTDTERIDWIEEQTKQGACLGLINDDNGHWAISDSGMQNCPLSGDPEDINTSFFVFAGEWKDSIREAIDFYIQSNSE
jgi:hypothetical protein